MLGSVDPYYLVGGGGVQCTILFCNKLIEWSRREKNFLKVESQKIGKSFKRKFSIPLWNASDMKQKLNCH
jgi:hypothetical protein